MFLTTATEPPVCNTLWPALEQDTLEQDTPVRQVLRRSGTDTTLLSLRDTLNKIIGIADGPNSLMC